MTKRKKKAAERSGAQDVPVRAVSMRRIGIAAAAGLLTLLFSAFLLSALTALGTLPAAHVRLYAGVAEEKGSCFPRCWQRPSCLRCFSS